MITLRFLCLFGAFICFALPAIKAMLDRRIDYTNSGLALWAFAILLLG